LEKIRILTKRRRLAGNQSKNDKMGGRESWFSNFVARKNLRNKLVQPPHILDKETSEGFTQDHTGSSKLGREPGVQCPVQYPVCRSRWALS